MTSLNALAMFSKYCANGQAVIAQPGGEGNEAQRRINLLLSQASPSVSYQRPPTSDRTHLVISGASQNTARVRQSLC